MFRHNSMSLRWRRDSHWCKILYIFIVVSVIAVISALAMHYSIRGYKHDHEMIPDERACIVYNFDSATVSASSSSTADKQEVSCFWRYHGWDKVQNDGNGESGMQGLKSLCSSWTDDHANMYGSFTIAVLVMLAVNLLFTYGFKLAFCRKIIQFRYKTSRDMLIASWVFVFHAVYFALVPTLVFDTVEHDMPRIWYRKVGVIYIFYFFGFLIMQPFEVAILIIVNKICTKSKKKNCVVQKELNEVMVGPEYEYSHKIGRIFAHIFIVFLYGPGLPLLYMILFSHLLIFWCWEKALLLKFYSKIELITTYARGFSIHILWFIYLTSCIMTISIYGSEDIFPTDTENTFAISKMTIVSYNKPISRTYGNKITLETGIPYLILAIISILLYTFLWFVHKDMKFFKVFRKMAFIYTPPKLKTSSYHNSQFFGRNTYNFQTDKKYEQAILETNKKLSGLMRESQHRVAPDVLSNALSVDESIEGSNNLNNSERMLHSKGSWSCFLISNFVI